MEKENIVLISVFLTSTLCFVAASGHTDPKYDIVYVVCSIIYGTAAFVSTVTLFLIIIKILDRIMGRKDNG